MVHRQWNRVGRRRSLAALCRVLPQLVLGAAIALACQRGERTQPAEPGERPAAAAQPILANAKGKQKQKRSLTFASCKELNQWDGVIDGKDVVFPAGCAYRGQVKFASSNVTLDCNSGSIEGSPDGRVIVKPAQPEVGGTQNNPHGRYARYEKLEGTSLEPLVAGVIIAQEERAAGRCQPEAPAVERIAIRNCTVRGFFLGIQLEREFEEWQDRAGSCKRVSERRYYKGYQPTRAREYTHSSESALDRSALYGRAPKHVQIINSIVERNGRAGILVPEYAQFFSIEGTTIRNNGGVGIYLGRESRKNTVKGSSVLHNGWGSLDAQVGYAVPGAPESHRRGREGIAIDASAHNTLSQNRIADNYKAGIALYKNCGEQHTPNKPAIIRMQHADHNTIDHNTIAQHPNRSRGKNDKTGYGIWIASRQGQEFDPTPGEFAHCRDPYVTTPKGEKRNYDYASFNTIANNTFEDNWCSLRVSDDNNQLVGNEFRGATKYDVYIGDTFRGEIGSPVRGTKIEKNRSLTGKAGLPTIVTIGGSSR